MLKLKFLCMRHRRWLQENRSAAPARWEQAYSSGLVFFEANNYLLAVRHAGTAFEISELLLGEHSTLTQRDINRFTDSATLLVHIMYRLNETRLANEVRADAIDRLESLGSCGGHCQTALQRCRRSLLSGVYAPKLNTLMTTDPLQAATKWPIQIH
ncbi:MAG: hypothetical protein ABJ013_08285 [Halioglobus sp.]